MWVMPDLLFSSPIVVVDFTKAENLIYSVVKPIYT